MCVCVCVLSFGKHTDTSVWDCVKKTDGSRKMGVCSVNNHLSPSLSFPPSSKGVFLHRSGLSIPSTINYSSPHIFVFLTSSSPLSLIISLLFLSADWRLLRTELACIVLPDLHIRQWIACMRVCVCASASMHG